VIKVLYCKKKIEINILYCNILINILSHQIKDFIFITHNTELWHINIILQSSHKVT